QQWREETPVAFVSVFEQEIIEQKQRLLASEQEIRTKEQEILNKNQEIRDREQEARDVLLRGIELALKLKFKEEGQALFTEIRKQTDPAWLRRFLDSIDPANSCGELRQLLP